MRSDGANLPAGYVELQLRFARRAEQIGSHDFASAIAQLTNLHRRFGLGDPTDPPDEQWTRYLDGLASRRGLAAQVRWTCDFAGSVSPTARQSGAVARSGPFSVHVHGDVARTHFVPRDRDLVSPLHASRLGQRRIELRTALAEAVRIHPEIRRVRGTSWLYSTDSYCKIFPPSHVSSAQQRTDVRRFQGSSAWGQFLSHRGTVKADLAERFVAAVEDFDGTDPWRLFPVPTLSVDSPIGTFDLVQADSSLGVDSS